jgi:hypothetical protein
VIEIKEMMTEKEIKGVIFSSVAKIIFLQFDTRILTFLPFSWIKF